MARLLAHAVLRPAFWPGRPATSAATRTPPVSRDTSTPTSTPNPTPASPASAPHTTRPPSRVSSHSNTHSRTLPARAPDHSEPALHRRSSTRQFTRLLSLTRGETTQRV